MPKAMFVALVLISIFVIIGNLWNLGILLAQPDTANGPIVISLVSTNGSLLALVFGVVAFNRSRRRPTGMNVTFDPSKKRLDVEEIVRHQREQIQRWGAGR